MRRRGMGGALALAVLAIGCVETQAPPDYESQLVPVSGVVTIDGEPAAGVDIVFKPAESRTSDARERIATGTTDENGKYTLSTLPGGSVDRSKFVGAIPGDYKVGFSRFLLSDGSVWDGSKSKDGPMIAGARESIPPRLVNPETSGYAVTVASGGKSHDFALKTK